MSSCAMYMLNLNIFFMCFDRNQNRSGYIRVDLFSPEIVVVIRAKHYLIKVCLLSLWK